MHQQFRRRKTWSMNVFVTSIYVVTVTKRTQSVKSLIGPKITCTWFDDAVLFLKSDYLSYSTATVRSKLKLMVTDSTTTWHKSLVNFTQICCI